MVIKYINILNHSISQYTLFNEKPKTQARRQLLPYWDLPKVKGIVDYMQAEDWSWRLPDFYNYTQTLDKGRNERLYDLIPEFEEYEK